ncbi:MAG: hypothetical protein KC416_03740 [Myxococcales bacterium]|nr:hypothetical protein [Myxococcales bacterium]
MDKPPPGAAISCETMADCNTSRCGALRACVDGLCEAFPSIESPCFDASGPLDASSDGASSSDSSTPSDAQ